jgi:hypothetical protein
MGLVVAFAATAAAGQQAQPGVAQGKDQYKQGKIVRVDPDKNVIVIRVGDGDKAKEMEYKVSKTTQFWGTDRKTLTDGLKFSGLKAGTEVWVLPGTGDNALTLTEVRLHNPALPPNPVKEK